MTLQALDPIYVDFYLPQQALGARSRSARPSRPRSTPIPVRNSPGRSRRSIRRSIPASRNVQVRATFGNPDEKLLPGMYATVDIDVGAPQHYVTLPQTAIAYNPYGDMVYVVEDDQSRRGRRTGAAACRAASSSRRARPAATRSRC